MWQEMGIFPLLFHVVLLFVQTGGIHQHACSKRNKETKAGRGTKTAIGRSIKKIKRLSPMSSTRCLTQTCCRTFFERMQLGLQWGCNHGKDHQKLGFHPRILLQRWLQHGWQCGMLRRCTVSVFLHPWACWQQLEVMAPGARFSMSVGMEIGMLREY